MGGFMRLLRRLLPPQQEARCLDCGHQTRERRRKPCPVCGSTGRVFWAVRDGDTLYTSDAWTKGAR